jgi:VanZ family protein
MQTAPLQAAPSGVSFPRRPHLLAAAVFFTAIAVYGSWVPLNYTPLDFDEAVRRFQEIPFLQLGVDSRADFVANILLFIPITFCWLGALTLDQKSLLLRLAPAAAVVLIAAAFSVVLEFSQLWFPGRTVSQNDIFAETVGGLSGAALWLIVGDRLVAWLRSVSNSRGAQSRFNHLLTLYVAGLLLYMLLPLDLTIRPAEIWRQLRDGKLELIPSLPSRLDLETIFGLLRDVVLWIPVGMWAAVWMTPRGCACRSLTAAVALSGGLLAATELAQVFVYSRYSSTSDVLLGLVGAAAGAAWIRFQRGGEWTAEDREGERRIRQVLGWLSLGLLAALAIGLYSCAPFQPLLTDRQLIEERFYGILRVPFAAMYRGTEFNAAGQILWKGGIFALMGAGLTMAVERLRLASRLRAIALAGVILASAGIALGIEICQVVLPPHVPDVTDVIISTGGAALGMFTALKISNDRSTA